MRLRIIDTLKLVMPRNVLGDTAVAIAEYYRSHRRIPSRRKPKSFNEHLLRIKWDGELYDIMRQFVSDKDLVKRYTAWAAGPQYAVETFAVLHDDAEVDTFVPSRFPCVIKPTHMSAEIIFLRDAKQEIDRERLKRWLRCDYYKMTREGNYRYLRPKVIVEEMLAEANGDVPMDYKFYCFFGQPKMIQVDGTRFSGHTTNYHAPDWTRLPFGLLTPCRETDDPRPDMLDEMLEVARKLSRPFSFIRVDMYTVGGQIKIGELTNVPGNCMGLFHPRRYDEILAALFEDKDADVLRLVERDKAADEVRFAKDRMVVVSGTAAAGPGHGGF